MKVASNFARAFGVLRQRQQLRLVGDIDLVEDQHLRLAHLAELAEDRVRSRRRCPSVASISTATRSASCAPLQAVVTMARSSRRFGAKMPGVSTKMSCALPAIAMPRTSARVVCTLGVTIATLLPISALVSVDLPAFGAPISAMKPQRLGPCSVYSQLQPSSRSTLHALALEHGGGRGLLGGALGAAAPFGRLALRQAHGDAEFRIVVRAGALDLVVGRRRQAARLRPFLQHGLGIAQRPHRRAHPLAPEPFDQRRRLRRSRHRETPRRPAPRRHRRGSRCERGRRQLDSDVPSRNASPRSIARATSAQVSRRTRSASRRDSSPSSPLGKARTACRR